MIKYKVGDKVLIKKWEDIVDEFGLDKYGDVNIDIHFAHDMQQFCNKICEIIEVDDDTYSYKIKEDDFGYWFSDDMTERKVNDMTKNDLRSGMIVETRDGERYITIVKEDDKVHLMNLNGLCYFGEDDDLLDNLDNVESINLDIIKIYKMQNTLNKCEKTNDLIWERQEKKEMTIAEIEKELGYSIKIIKEEK